jgi:hypothetical protein
MAKRIATLTDEHRALIPVVRDEWIQIGHSCDPADRARAERGVDDAYAAAGLPAPPVKIWIPSPIGGAIGDALVAELLKQQAATRTGVRDGVGAGVGAGVWDGVRDGVWDGVWDGVRAGVWDGVWDGVRDGVGDGVRDGVRDGVGTWNDRALWGQHEIGLSFYDFFRRVGLGDIVAPLDGMTAVARNAGWWWCRRGYVVLTDRPERLRLEPAPNWGEHGRRLHCADGPAVRYRDGWELHFWHGTRVPADLVEGDGWSTEQILRERNAEVRRCAIERIGWDRFAERAALTVVHEADDPGNPGQRLRLCDVPAQIFGTPARVLVCTNGSPERDGVRRRFGRTVPASFDDAIAAAAWTYDLDRDTYAGAVRRT